MYQENFIKIDKEETIDILKDVNKALSDIQFDTNKSTVLSCPLSFYPEFKILEVASFDSIPQKRVFAVYQSGKVTLINWAPDTIYDLNKSIPINLSDSTIIDYVRFFFRFVHGKSGRLKLIETMDDISWKEDLPPAAQRAIRTLIDPVYIEDRDKKGNYKLKAVMTIKDALLTARILVSSDGTVEITNEELLVEEMPVLDDVLEH